MSAAAVAPSGVNGVFEMTVRATGRQDGWLYINSQLDYRDPRNLSVSVSPQVQRQLTRRFGERPEDQLKGKIIAVEGSAKRVRVDFTTNGRPTGKYYYQTHVQLGSAERLTVLADRP